MLAAMKPKPPPRPAPLTPAEVGARRSSPAAGRNKGPVLEVLRRVFPQSGTVLEVAAGAGEHAAFFAAALPGVTWFPTELDPDGRASIIAWTEHEGLANVRPPVALDARDPVWPVEVDAPFDAMLCMNMIHIAPWEAALGLLAGADRVLRLGGVLVLYGPYTRNGAHTAPSNAAFDESLKARDPSWGVRDLGDVEREAAAQGLALDEVVEMPANNLTVVFRKA